MTAVHLDDTEWRQILYVLWTAEGPRINQAMTNPLTLKIGAQLKAQDEKRLHPGGANIRYDEHHKRSDGDQSGRGTYVGGDNSGAGDAHSHLEDRP